MERTQIRVFHLSEFCLFDSFDFVPILYAIQINSSKPEHEFGQMQHAFVLIFFEFRITISPLKKFGADCLAIHTCNIFAQTQMSLFGSFGEHAANVCAALNTNETKLKEKTM